MKKLYCLAFILLFSLHAKTSFSQCVSIHHWEAAVLDNTVWKYTIPTTSLSNWNQPSFNDASWQNGTGGIGYGDGDDATIIANNTTVLYMRKTFSIVNTAAIDWAVFCMDYDDGFVAYLNGVEIARSNISATGTWNAFATASHEARIYQGEQPAFYSLRKTQITSLLQNGNNVLAIETRNTNNGLDDLSSRPFLMLGINNTSFNYQSTPNWFTPPMAFETKLPVMMVRTHAQTIIDDPRIICDMGLIYNGPGANNCVSDSFNNYYGKISIEYRGSSSQMFPKSPYGFSTIDETGAARNVSLLGMPEENDWVLLNPYTDKTFMRDLMTYDLGRSLGWYASRAQFLELFIDGDYKGVYVLLEKIKRDDERVDISKIDNTMNSGDALTGGYIFKVDKTTGSSNGGWYSATYGVSIQNHVPEWDEITATQQNYLQNYIDNFETVLNGAGFANAINGYRKTANVFSFADLFILNEVSNNVDGYRLSTFIHKDRDSKCGRFTMGPIWDYNLTFGNANYCNGYPTYGWQMYQGCGEGSSKWINRMLQDTWFKNLVSCRYAELRQSVLSTSSLLSRVDSYRNYLLQAHVRDSLVWQTIGTYVWPNAWIASSWQGEVDSMKQWITQRMQWLDANMYSSTSPCNAASTLSLVIDEINYHSDSTTDAGDWIEIHNTGNTTANLSQCMIFDPENRERYCILPNNLNLAAGARLVIYADSLKFATAFPSVTNKFGPLCFKLSDGGQTIALADANNRKIFQVTYSDSWQCATDGNGRTLQLTTSSANPNLASSWFASCMGGSPGVAYIPCNENPIYSEINYHSSSSQDAGDWIELHNRTSATLSLSGWKLKDENNTNVFNLPNGYTLSANAYVVLYADGAKFNAQFPTIFNKLGPTGFGLSDASEVIRLFDNTGKLKYSVCYLNQSPWPTTPNGGGYTLENNQYTGNANNGSNWIAGCPEGSPGKVYNPQCFPLDISAAIKDERITIYPNPSSTFIYLGGILSPEKTQVYDLQGRAYTLPQTQNELDVRQLIRGMYVVKVLKDGVWYVGRFTKE